MRQHSRYRDSGIDWIGDIPEHWEVQKTKVIWDEIDERSDDGSEKQLSVSKYTGVTPYGEDQDSRAESLEGYLRCEPGDLVINIMLAWQGCLGVAEDRGVVSPAYCVYRTSDRYNPRFFHYLYRSDKYLAEFARCSSGIVPSRWRMYTKDFFRVYSVVPPRPEQDAIADYLDEKTDDIDDYIAKKRELVDLLETQRRAVVNRAVTTGLDDDVKMQDSGVEWLGEIPAHWEERRLKHASDEIIDCKNRTPPYYDNGEYFVVRTANVKGGSLDFSEAYYTDEEGFEEWTRRGVPRPNDLLFTREAPAGEACLVPEDLPLCMGQRMMCIRPVPDTLLPKFLLYMIYSDLVQGHVAVSCQGSTSTHMRLGQVYDTPVLIPPLDEQKRIVDHIDAQTADIDAAIERAERQIDLMQQYRTSLVTEVVTGAVDVRAEVAA
jgi:type I restriction enzyme S subunit